MDSVHVEKELISILTTHNSGIDLRCAAAEGLGEVASPAAQQALLLILKDNLAGIQLRSVCAKALGRTARSR